MLQFKLISQFRNNCVIQGRDDLLKDFKVGDIIFIIISNPTKTFSILSKIEAKINKDEKIIYVDRRIIGNLADNDIVTILKHNPAEAIKIFLAISEEYTKFSSGDWTQIIRKYVVNKVVDFGQEFSFMIPWSDEERKHMPPIGVSGLVFSTLPTPPVKIGSNTKIIINKFTASKIEELKQENLKSQEERVTKLEKEIKMKTFYKIQRIKQKNYPNKAVKYEFKKTNPAQLFNAIIGLFKGFEIVEEPNEKVFKGESQNYFGTAVFFTDEISKSLSIIDIQVLANDQNGRLILNIASKNEELIYEYLNKYDQLIRNIKGGLEQKVKLNVEICPNCGAPLHLNNVDTDGIIKCEYCRNFSILPKSYRY